MDANQGGRATSGGLMSLVGKALVVTVVVGVAGAKVWLHAGPQASQAAQQQKVQEYQQVTGAIKHDVLAELEREGVISEGSRKAAVERLDQHLAKESDAGGDVGALMRAQRRWLAMMNQEAARIDATQNSLAEAPGFGDCRFESVEQVERAIELAKAAEAECVKVERLARRAPDVLRALLEEEGVSAAASRGFMGGAGNALSMSVKVRECETGVVRAARGQLEILRDEWGAWGIDEGGQLAFDSDGAEKRFVELAGEIESLGAESARLTKELLKARRQR